MKWLILAIVDKSYLQWAGQRLGPHWRYGDIEWRPGRWWWCVPPCLGWSARGRSNWSEPATRCRRRPGRCAPESWESRWREGSGYRARTSCSPRIRDKRRWRKRNSWTRARRAWAGSSTARGCCRWAEPDPTIWAGGHCRPWCLPVGWLWCSKLLSTSSVMARCTHRLVPSGLLHAS